MQAIDLGDTLSMEKAEVDASDLEPDNLVWQAIRLFRAKTSIHQPVKVALEKRIPMEAGLGGGSSDGATALWAINELVGRPVTTEQLQQWSGEIGADLPFFFSSGTAVCTGTGTTVEEIAPLPQRTVWILKPEISLPTKSVYGRLKIEQNELRDRHLWAQEFVAGALPLRNDLEPAAFSIAPHLREIYDQLEAPLIVAGSGSSLVSFGSAPPRGFGRLFEASFLRREPQEWYAYPGK